MVSWIWVCCFGFVFVGFVIGFDLIWWLYGGFVVFERWCSVLSVTLISCFIVITIVWMFV